MYMKILSAKWWQFVHGGGGGGGSLETESYSLKFRCLGCSVAAAHILASLHEITRFMVRDQFTICILLPTGRSGETRFIISQAISFPILTVIISAESTQYFFQLSKACVLIDICITFGRASDIRHKWIMNETKDALNSKRIDLCQVWGNYCSHSNCDIQSGAFSCLLVIYKSRSPTLTNRACTSQPWTSINRL